jgi:hypothetical protein
VRLESASGVDEVRLACDDQVANTLAAFVAAVRRGGLPDPVIEDWLRQADLLDRVREAGSGTTSG